MVCVSFKFMIQCIIGSFVFVHSFSLNNSENYCTSSDCVANCLPEILCNTRVDKLIKKDEAFSHSCVQSEAPVTGDTLEKQLRNASLVIRGKVAATNILSEKAGPAISEHDPVLRKAIIEIKQVLKGKIKAKKIVLSYASSDDVMWYNSPKLKKGQEAIFLLHSAEAADNQAGYPVLRRENIQKLQDLGKIQALLKK